MGVCSSVQSKGRVSPTWWLLLGSALDHETSVLIKFLGSLEILNALTMEYVLQNMRCDFLTMEYVLLDQFMGELYQYV